MSESDLKSLAPDLANGAFPRSPRELLAGYVVAARTLDKCRAVLAGTNGEYHFDCPLDNFFLGFTGISADDLKDFVATGADDEAVAAWIEKNAKPRDRPEIIQWNNDMRYKRINEMPLELQEKRSLEQVARGGQQIRRGDFRSPYLALFRGAQRHNLGLLEFYDFYYASPTGAGRVLLPVAAA